MLDGLFQIIIWMFISWIGMLFATVAALLGSSWYWALAAGLLGASITWWLIYRDDKNAQKQTDKWN